MVTLARRRREPPHRVVVASVRLFIRRRAAVLFVLPALALIAVFHLVPNVSNLAYAFTDWSVYGNGTHWIGLSNFRQLWHSSEARASIFVTLKFAAIVGVAQNVVSLGLALMLEKTTRINGVFRSILFVPVVISTLSAGYIFRGILDPNGVLNRALSIVTFHHISYPWLGSTSWTIVILGLIEAWKAGGVTMLIYIAALNAVPQPLLEAARLEGASTWRIIRKVKLPLIVPAFTFNVTLSLIAALSGFALIIATTNGGPGTATEVLNMFVYQQFGYGNFGYATAMGLVLFLAVCALALPLIVFFRRREVEF